MLQIVEGTNQIQRLVIARALGGLIREPEPAEEPPRAARPGRLAARWCGRRRRGLP